MGLARRPLRFDARHLRLDEPRARDVAAWFRPALPAIADAGLPLQAVEVCRPRVRGEIRRRQAARGTGAESSLRFFAGGARTVRGVPEDSLGGLDFIGEPIGGRGLLTLNQEMRFPVYRWLRGVVFVDMGNVFPEVSGVRLQGSCRVNRIWPAPGDAVRAVQGGLRQDDLEPAGRRFGTMGVRDWADVLTTRDSGFGSPGLGGLPESQLRRSRIPESRIPSSYRA